MPSDTLNEREFELVNIVGAKIGSNQRDLSRHMDLSLGMTNMLIRRLITKGYIRIKQLNKRKVEYILTPRGLSEKMRKSVKYTLKTINSIGLIKNRLHKILSELYAKGERKFAIFGRSDLALLVEIVLKEVCVNGHEVLHIQNPAQERINGILLICTEDYKNGGLNNNSINMIEELAKDNEIFSMRGDSVR